MGIAFSKELLRWLCLLEMEGPFKFFPRYFCPECRRPSSLRLYDSLGGMTGW